MAWLIDPGRVHWQLLIHSPQNSAFSRVFGTALFQLVGMAMTLLVGVQLARFLGPGQYGIYGTLIGVVSVAAVFAQAALPQLLIRDLAPLDFQRDEGTIDSLFRRSVRVFMISGGVTLLAAIVVVLVAEELVPSGVATGFFWALPLIIAFALLNIVSGVLRGFHQVVLAQMVAACLRPSAFATVLLIAWVAGVTMSASNALLAQLVALVFVIAVGVVLIKKHLPPQLKEQAGIQPLPPWRKDMPPMMLTELIRALDAQLAILLLALLTSETDVGFYRVAMSSAVLFAFPYTVANLLLMPSFAKDFAEGDLAQLESRARSASAWCAGATLASLLILFLLGEPLVTFVFGSEYQPAVQPLLILGLAYLLQAALGPGAAVLNMCNRSSKVTKAYVLGLLLTVVLAFPLERTLGLQGMAWAVVGGFLGRSAMLWLAARQAFSLNVSLFSPTWLKHSVQRG